MISAKLKGAKQISKGLKAESKRQKKAMQTSVKVEGFRLKKQLQKEIRSGDPGGKRFEPLTFIARRQKRRFKPNKPLSRLAVAVRYHLRKKDPVEVAVGWTGPRVSESWRKIAEKQQEGFDQKVTRKQRRFFMHKGEGISKRSANRKYLFLKTGTKTLSTPERPIIDPFWNKHRVRALRNIRRNFQKKMAGERI